MSTQITIEGIEQPREGAKMGSVKAGGRYYKVWPDKLDGFAVGSTYEVETETNEFKGKTFHKIKTSKLVGGNGNGAKSNVTQSAHSPSGHVDGRSEPATSKDAYWTRKEQNDLAKQPRIERQHAQHMALLAIEMLIASGEKLAAPLRKVVQDWTDWFQRDVGHAPTAPASENAHRLDAMREQGMHGGVGDNEGDFAL